MTVDEAEAWPAGIQREYLDNADRPTRLSEATVDALRAALGEPDPDASSRAPVVVRPGAMLDAAADGVRLTDGTELELRPGEPADLPLGYHWLHDAGGERRLIVSPGACVLPPRRAWGWAAQLYATRSRASWGIGDLADLRRLTALARDQDAGFVLVNPLHAAAPEQPSPYFPTSRRFFHPSYLAVPEVDAARDVLGARLDEFDRSGRALNADRHIDRTAVWRLKSAALREVFDRSQAARSVEFARWRADRGRAVEDFATWWILAERYDGRWPDWPADARRPDGAAARAVRTERPDDVAFVAWLQWQLERQLRAAGDGVPIMQDLPIGVDPGGADAWAYQDVLALDVTVGAPPDPFNRDGQDWGLPPFVPWRLRAADYEPFVEAVRATMALAGGLRIDHVMGLFRLWWIPSGYRAGDGGYVRYPAADLLDIVALESVRANAPVVGEDLGTVEPGVREELATRNVLSYRVLWFEPEPPPRWPVKALAAATTHDLPTVAGVWDGSDLADQRRWGVAADEEAAHDLRDLLVTRGGVEPNAPVDEAVGRAYRLLGRAPSLLVAASLDDALAEPVRVNIPGTVDRPNWTRALAVPIDEFADHPGVRTVADGLRRDEPDGRGGKWWTLVAVCLGTFMLLLDITIVNVALPDIQTSLGSSFADLQWVVDAYALTLAALLLTAGSLADMFGRRRLYLIGLSLFTVASLLCGLAQDTLFLQLSRGLQGVGGAITFSVSLALLGDAFRGKDRGTAFGIWGAITGLAVAIGPLVGGVLTTGLSWRYIFFVNLPIGVVAVVLTARKVAESKAPHARRPDWPGFAAFTAALALLVYALIESNRRSFGDPLVIGCLVAAAVLLVVFLVVERRRREPMFDLSLFRLPTFVGGSITAFGLSASIFALLLYLVLYLQDVLGFSALGTGLRLLLLSAGTLVTAALAGRLSSHVPVRLLIGPGLLLVGAGLLLLRGITATSGWTHLIPGLIVGGLGVGLINPPLASTAIGVVTPERAGMASGINSTFRQVGIATGIALLGTLFTNRVSHAVAIGAAHVPALHGHGDRLAQAVQSGQLGRLIGHLPPNARAQAHRLAAGSFGAGLNLILLVAAIIALVSAVVAFATIRRQDFAQQSA